MGESTPSLGELTVDQMAKVLSAAGEHKITLAMIRADIDLGAPTNTNGTLSLVYYMAWMIRREAARGN